MLKIRRPLGRLIFNMGIAIPGKTVFLIETAPCCSLTHWGRDKMAAISQTTLSIAFSWMKILEFRLNFQFVPKGPINNIPALVQIMAWRRPGDKPLSESVMVSLLTHICVTRPQWVNVGSSSCHSDNAQRISECVLMHLIIPGNLTCGHLFDKACNKDTFRPPLVHPLRGQLWQ